MLPAGDYEFLEQFCDEPGCDCRRVFFYVVYVVARSRPRPMAVIAWGWENLLFYSEWMKSEDPRMLSDLKGPVLNAASPQSELAPALVLLVQEVLLKDPDYIERIKRHYALFRARIEAEENQPDWSRLGATGSAKVGNRSRSRTARGQHRAKNRKRRSR